MAIIEHDFRSAAPAVGEAELAQARLRVLDLLDRSVHASVAQYTNEAEAERDAARLQAAHITKRLQDVNAQLQDAHLQKDRFLSVLSHELRNPLSPILTAVQVLKRTATAATERHYAIIERQAKHLVRLVDDLLDLNRIAYGKLELRPELMILQDAAALAIETARGAFDEKNVQLRVDFPPQPVPVFADPTRLVQVVLNLLTNALKFSSSGADVAVALHSDAHEAHLTVRDSGAGIAPEMLPRIFEPFQQADTSLARSGGGLGLGLMIAKGLLEAQGGRVEARSPGIDKGAEFTIHLPLSPGVPARQPAEAGTREAVPARRIAIVEDNDDAREALAVALRLLGHEVFTAGSGEEAFALARAQNPDVFILDIGLPGLDGYAVARGLRALPDSAHVRLFAVTGYGSETDKSAARAAGFERHFTKPVDVDVLEELLR